MSASAGVAANIHYGDVLIKFGEYLDMRKETFPWIEKQTDADKFRTSFLQDGDVVFADTAEDETAGKCCEIRNCGSMVMISGLHTIPCRPESKFASGYLVAILFSFAATCKANGVNYRQWLEDILIRINTTPASQIDSLLPQNWNLQPTLKYPGKATQTRL